MGDYTQITNFTAKDSLATGNAAKKIKGSDFDGELSAISTAIASKSENGSTETITGAWTFSDGVAFNGENVYSKTETWKLGADVASATALPVNIDGNIFDVTGTTTITSLATKGVGTIVVLQFDSALILTHHASNLVLPDGQNITTAAGDVAVLYEYASADWRLLSFQRATLGGYTTAIQTFTADGTWTKPANLISAIIEVQGGGGGGGGTANPGGTEAGAGSGGGGGGYARKMLLAADLGATESVTVGGTASGGSSSDGTTGNASTFAVASGTNIVGNGGVGGNSAGTTGAGVNVEQGAGGGTATGGDINITGGATGGAFSMANSAWGGGHAQALAFPSPGGSGFFGGGGGSSPATEDATQVGGAGTHGGGGGGSGSGDTGGAATGGAGGAGLVVVTEFIKAL